MSAPPAMARRHATAVFAVFAFAYFFSPLIFATAATLVTEFALNARDLGLLQAATDSLIRANAGC